MTAVASSDQRHSGRAQGDSGVGVGRGQGDSISVGWDLNDLDGGRDDQGGGLGDMKANCSTCTCSFKN